MNRRIASLLVALFLLPAGFLAAQNASISYLEGNVTLEKTGTPQRYAEIGDGLSTGDTLYTAADSLAEIDLGSGSTVSIGAESVFNLGEIADPESESRKRGFFRVLLGSVSFKFRNLAREPEVGTPLTVCSVRGTDFTVYAAPDGASMTVVSDGLVEVSSGGDVALLAAGEGVEASAGLGLGETFEAKKGYINYEDYAEIALNRVEDDPISALSFFEQELQNWIDQAQYYTDSYQINRSELLRLREEAKKILTEDGEEESQAFKLEFQGPVQARGFDLATTARHNIVSGFLFRRHLLAGLYIRIRTKYLADLDDPIWVDFSKRYTRLLQKYEDGLVPLLEEEDL